MQIMTMVLITHVLSGLRMTKRVVGIFAVFSLSITPFFYLATSEIGEFFLLLFLCVYLFMRTRKYSISFIAPLLMVLVLLAGIYILSGLTRVFIGSSIESLRESTSFWVLDNLLLFFICLGMSVFLKYLFNKLELSLKINKRYIPIIMAFLSLILVSFYSQIFIFRDQGFTTENARLILLFFLINTGLLITVMMILIFVTAKSIQVEREKAEYQQMQIYLNELENQHKEVREFRHDYINVLLTMRNHVEEKDAESLFSYLKEEIFPIGEQLQLKNYQLSLLSNIEISEVKGILVSKVIQAQNLGIETLIDIPNTIHSLSIGKLDLCRVLGILLDNAIEESQNCVKPVIKIGFFGYEKRHLIIVENSSQENLPAISTMFQNGFSTKEGSHRGQGLAILQKLLNKTENAKLETVIKENFFMQKITIRE